MSTDETSSGAFTDHVFSRESGTGDAPKPDNSGRMADFSTAVDLLHELTHAGLEDIDVCLQDTVEKLGRLADNVEHSLSGFNDDDPDVLELVDFVVQSSHSVRSVALGDQSGDLDREQLDLLKEAVELRLESCDTSSDFDGSDFDGSDFQDDDDARCETDGDWDGGDANSTPEPDVVAPTQAEIAELLRSLSAQTSAITPDDAGADVDPAIDPHVPDLPAESPSDQSSDDDVHVAPIPTSSIKVGGSDIAMPAIDEIDIDDELREAFMDDATRGLESMEQALLDLESDPNDEGPIKTISRELHTIKGASASIGMSNLADYIHEVEELIRQTQDAGRPVTPELLLPHVDLIRARVDGDDAEATTEPLAAVSAAPSDAARANSSPASSSPAPNAPATSQPAPAARPAKKNTLADSHGDDETVRVKASQLNRLMDMLSELVMLRNQRDTEISELKGIHDELIHSVTRIRMLSHEGEALLAGDSLANPVLAEDGVSFSHLNEVANDVLESAQRLRDCYRPVADGNQAVSQFIRNFRLELVQLRRMPVSGLFRRLHRAISDAARTEQKQVRVELVGENTGIERSLQERIFEPLLHIVRNSVSHGIETPGERATAGKTPQGVVRLHAHSGPDLLVIEVSDDGRGLDFDAIRRRGIERGLIDGDKSVSHAELSRLIFNPGFSTREAANQLSGRGVGMDVVASTLERMRGWVEVDSEHGTGSTIRLSLPLPSMIQHAMVFRSAGQLFALPAQSVRRTGEFDPEYSPIDLNEILSLPVHDRLAQGDYSRRAIIELASGAASVEGETGGDFALLVDRVLGPEEVVVRPMPPMLKSHPLCIGATLSGMGEVVLLLDPRGLAEASKGSRQVVLPVPTEKRPADKDLPKILVVDDSKSARLRVTRALAKYPVNVIQVEDGQAAVEMLSKDNFATVFSDIDMPRMSGLELLQTIKGDPKLASTPVIVISSRSLETAGKQARQFGAMEYIQKPLTPERFDDVVESLDWAALSPEHP
ncbi:hybrid sensor histidine kinase/response regulator [Rhodopirellula sp. JC639]|uniref:hybrid sensor histidine kinase/response regulator n=1 Tax=Stieleria mannarensis TaxID=2755585 RepID=UPI001600A0E4|nr:response regulator [Rhodopirellula sp. JC639]